MLMDNSAMLYVVVVAEWVTMHFSLDSVEDKERGSN